MVAVAFSTIFGNAVVVRFVRLLLKILVLLRTIDVVNRVVKVAAVLFTFGSLVILSTLGKVEEMAFVNKFIVTLPAAAIIGLLGLGQIFFADTDGPKHASNIYAKREPTVSPVVYERVIIFPVGKKIFLIFFIIKFSIFLYVF